MQRKRPRFGPVVFYVLVGILGAYFTFAAVQGEYGLFNRIQIQADADRLRAERDQLAAELAVMENRTYRLSDQYLDLDLLDERAREVLGLARVDELALR